MAVLYGVAAFSNSSRLQESSDKRFDNMLGSCFFLQLFYSSRHFVFFFGSLFFLQFVFFWGSLFFLQLFYSSKHYIGCTETEFKTRYYNHTHSFRYREKRNATELSKAFWNAKDSYHEPLIKWSIADRATAYQPGSRSCNLCLTEKLAILLADKRTALNKRSELTGKCRHKNKYKLKNVRA